MVAVWMMKIIILKRMKIKLILLLSGDLEGRTVLTKAAQLDAKKSLESRTCATLPPGA